MTLEYNTERPKLAMPEYGRHILKMVQDLKGIEDKQKRSQQAVAIVKAMEMINPQVHSLDNFEHKLWDQLYMIAGFDLDIDAPYPCPEVGIFEGAPMPISMKDTKIKAYHYGRNIERIINLLCEEEDSNVKREMIRNLATYMRQQYLIWNKDSVADETIFKDIEKLSDYRLSVPRDIQLSKISNDASFARPNLSINVGQAAPGKNRQFKNKRRLNKKK